MKNLHEHQFFLLLSQYTTLAVVRKFSELNFLTYTKQRESKSPVYTVDISGLNLPTKVNYLHLKHWALRDIILYKLKKSNIHNANLKSSMSDRDAFEIILYFSAYEDLISGSSLKKVPFYYFLTAYGDQQFRSQVNAYEHYWKRNSIMFDVLDTEKLFNLEDVIQDGFSMSYDEYRFFSFLLIAIPLTEGCIEIKSKSNEYFSKIKFEKSIEKIHYLIDRYTATIENMDIISVHQAAQQFAFTEVDGQNFIIDCFDLQEKLADGFIWAARNYYQKYSNIYESNYFPNNFGLLFERYIEYAAVQSGQSDHLFNVNNPIYHAKFFSHSNGKRIDYVLETDQYILLIEVKSGIKPLAAKEVFNNQEGLNRYFEKTVVKGAEQIISTYPFLLNKVKIVKGVIITYEETYAMTHAKYEYLKSIDKKHLNEVLLISIHEFELILDMLKKRKFDEMFEEYLNMLDNGDFWDFATFIINDKSSNFSSYLSNLEKPFVKEMEKFFFKKTK